LIVLVGLKNARDLQIRKFSRGMLQRLGIAQALINDPEILILDEPMSGLDPFGRKEFKEIIRKQRELGKTILFSSHILADAEDLCDRIGILVGGSLKYVGSLREILDRHIESFEVTAKFDDAAQIEKIRQEYHVINIRGSVVRVMISSEGDVSGTAKAFIELGGKIESIIPKRKSLEDIFIEEAKGL